MSKKLQHHIEKSLIGIVEYASKIAYKDERRLQTHVAAPVITAVDRSACVTRLNI